MARHPTVCVVNHSTEVSDEEVRVAIVALQRQVTYHFEPHWNAGCTLLQVQAIAHGAAGGTAAQVNADQLVESDGLELDPGAGMAATIVDAIPAGAWLLVIADDSDQAGALGYHEVDARAVPLGYVFAKTDAKYGLSWTVTASHELLEMLGDPLANLCVQVKADGTALAYETADAVEADEDGYHVYTAGGPVLVSDFVFPNWFVAESPGPWDYRGLLTAPLELRPGGYIGVWRPGKGWTQQVAQGGESIGQAVAGALAGALGAAPAAPRHEAGPRFRMRSEGRGRADHAQGDLPAWLEG